MMADGSPVSIAALLASGVPLRPHEAVAIVFDLCGHLNRHRAAPGIMPAISTLSVTIDPRGAVAVTGGIPGEDDQTVSLAGRLLLDMLDRSAAAAGGAIPPRLRSIALRAASDGRDAFASAAQFMSALRRHRPTRGEAQAIRSVYDRWAVTGRGRLPAVAVVDPRPSEQDRSRHVPQPAAALEQGSGPAGGRRIGVRRAVLVGGMLLVLAGAGFVFVRARTVDDLPFVAPVSKPTPVLPRRQPGWELLERPERTSANPAPRNAPARQARAGKVRELTSPPPSDLPGASR
jgi:hypothetical protein